MPLRCLLRCLWPLRSAYDSCALRAAQILVIILLSRLLQSLASASSYSFAVSAASSLPLHAASTYAVPLPHPLPLCMKAPHCLCAQSTLPAHCTAPCQSCGLNGTLVARGKLSQPCSAANISCFSHLSLNLLARANSSLAFCAASSLAF